MDSPLLFIFAETLVRVFKIAGLTFLACVAFGVLLAIFGKRKEDAQP